MLEALVLSSVVKSVREKEQSFSKKDRRKRLMGTNNVVTTTADNARAASALVSFVIIFMVSFALSVFALSDARSMRGKSLTPSADVIIAYSSPMWYWILKYSGMVGTALPDSSMRV